MAKYIIMPKLGFNMNEGKIVQWLKNEDDFIEEQEVLLRIETDKSVIDVESNYTGILAKILVPEGEVIPVTLPIGIISERDEDIDDMVQEALKKIENADKNHNKINVQNASNEKLSSNEMNFNGKNISPRARKKAEEFGIDLAVIERSTPKKLITEKDVIDFVEKEQSYKVKSENDNRKEVLIEIPYSGIRKIIGDRLSTSKFSAPHIYFTISVDMHHSLLLLNYLKNEKNVHISVNDFLVFVTARILSKHNKLNVSLINDVIQYFSSVNIGIAVGLEDGLVVPVIKNADQKSLLEISEESKKLIKLAREDKLLPDDYSHGTFTISNLGMYDIEQFTAIINPPESAILAVGNIQKTPIVDEYNHIVIKPVLKMTLSVDHRLIDGAIAAMFLKELKSFLLNPSILVV